MVPRLGMRIFFVFLLSVAPTSMSSGERRQGLESWLWAAAHRGKIYLAIFTRLTFLLGRQSGPDTMQHWIKPYAVDVAERHLNSPACLVLTLHSTKTTCCRGVTNPDVLLNLGVGVSGATSLVTDGTAAVFFREPRWAAAEVQIPPVQV